MTTLPLPLIIEADELDAQSTNDQLLIVDLCKAEQYQQAHIPGAIHLLPSLLSCGIKPATGKLPSIEQLTELFSNIGLTADKHVIAYDDGGGAWAGRLIWTLDVIGHKNYSFLNGGLTAWINEDHAVEQTANQATASDITITIDNTPIADLDDILSTIKDDHTLIWDARSPQEYSGEKILAAKGGHIPGAISFEWTQALDQDNNLRIKHGIQDQLNAVGITQDKHIITHCQTHRRSGLTYVVAKSLGYKNIKAYPGSWSEWGNHPDTPVEL